MTELERLLKTGPDVVNVGIREFTASLEAQHIPVVQVDWKPPPKLDDDLSRLLEALE